jgi:hypothetical protein
MALTEVQKLTGAGVELTFADEDGDPCKYVAMPFTLSDLGEMEARWGSIEAMGLDRKDATTVHFLLWLSLRHKRPELTFEEVGDLFTAFDFPQLKDVMNGFFPQAPKDEGSPPSQTGSE